MRLEDKKILQLRKANGITQIELASAIYSDVSKVIKVEKGVASYADVHMRYLRKFFDIEGMPLSEFEVTVYKTRLYMFHDSVRDRRFDEAKALHKGMSKLTNLDVCDDDLPVLYSLFEVALLIYGHNDIDAAEKKLDYFQDKIDKMTDEHKYHYYFYAGILHTRRGRYEDSMECYKQALDLSHNLNMLASDDIKRVHLGIATCYSFLELPHRAIVYSLNAKSRKLYEDRKISIYDLHFDINLSLNYIRVNELERAEKLLYNCLVYAKSIEDNYYYGWTLYNYGLLNKQSENWDRAIDYFKQTMECYEKRSNFYLKALYESIRCWVGKRKYSKAQKMLDETKPLYENDEIYHIIFKALGDYITIRSRISLYNQPTDFIEKEAIPHFEKTCDFFLAIDYYQLLESYYAEKNAKKSLLITEAIRKIYERCFINKVEREGGQ